MVEPTFTRTLKDSTFFGGSGSEENWMAEGDAAGYSESRAGVRGGFWSILGQRRTRERWRFV